MPTITALPPASDKQISYLESLFVKVYGADQAAAQIDTFRSACGGTIDIKQASKQIDVLKFAKPAGTVTVTIPNGIHYIAQRVYRIRESKSGNQYAERLLTIDERPDNEGKPWLYEGRKPLATASEATLLTLEQAKVFGKGYGICALCGALLEDPDSVEAGIGPVCAKKF